VKGLRVRIVWVGVSFHDDDDDDVYLKYYSGKGFHINYCLHVLRKTHKLVQ
jgi:hypothetical protein